MDHRRRENFCDQRRKRRLSFHFGRLFALRFESLGHAADQLFTGRLAVNLGRFNDQLVEGNAIFIRNIGEELREAGMAAGEAEHQIQRLDRRMISMLFHNGDQLLIEEMQEGIKVDLIEKAQTLEVCDQKLRRAIAGATGHTQQTAVKHRCAGFHGGDGVGDREAEVVVAVESNGNVDSGRQGFDIFGDLMRRHRAGRVHNGDFVKTAVGEHLGFLSKLLCREHIGLHQRITALDSGGFDQTDALAGTCAVTGVCADAQELQAVFFCQSNIGFVYILVAKEHADLGLGQIWSLVTTTPQAFRGGEIWNTIVTINDGLKAFGYGLLVLFFAMSVFRSAASFRDLQRPEFALRHFIRFIIAKVAVGSAMEIMTAVFSVCGGVVQSIMGCIGGMSAASVTLPQEIADAIEEVGFFQSVPLWMVTFLGSLFITVLSFILIMTVYGRFFRLYMFTALAPLPLASFAGEDTSFMGKAFLKSYLGVCMEGAIVVLACLIFSAFAASGAPIADTSLPVVTMSWQYVAQTIFNMLILVALIKGAERIAKEMFGL